MKLRNLFLYYRLFRYRVDNLYRNSYVAYIAAHTVAVFLLCLWHVQITGTGRWPSGDGPHILGTSARLSQLLLDGDWSLFVHCFSSLLGPHPPFAYLLHTVGSLIGGTNDGTHLIGGFLALLLAFNAFYRMRTAIVGFLWLISLSPVWLQAESAGIDLVAGAVVLQSISFLISSNKLERFWPTCLWGAFMGVAFMTKYTAPIFLVGPTIVAAFWILKLQRWKRLFQAFAAFSVVALPWWSTHTSQVLGYVSASGNADSGLLTNKAIIDTPWYNFENLSWYPASIADAAGWPTIFIFIFASLYIIGSGKVKLTPTKHASPPSWSLLRAVLSLFKIDQTRKSNMVVLFSSVLFGWLILNAQSQRQDRYVIPSYFPAAALIASSPLKYVTSFVPLLLLRETQRIYTDATPAPSERNYHHSYHQSGVTFPVPSVAYHPTAQDPKPWKLDDTLNKLYEYHGSKNGTVGFLLDERNGAPGYGMVLSRATALGYRWNIATVVMAQPGHHVAKEKDRPMASIFVGPFWLGNWPSKEFTVLLSILEHPPSRKVNDWLRVNQFVAAETWELPHNRVGVIYTKDDPE